LQTLGIDFSAQPLNTAAALVHWTDGRAVVKELEIRVDDARIMELAHHADKVGLDVPFGWPDAFVDAVRAHSQFQPWPGVEHRRLRFRKTDLHVHERTGKWPLSVSTDRIGITAFRAARILAMTGSDRTGKGKFVEVYPRAARDRFGVDRSLATLLQEAPWIEMDSALEQLCMHNDHCHDALIGALVTRASALGLCDPIPAEVLDEARREGWIALPLAGSLSQLSHS
jgi:hypothetical protein